MDAKRERLILELLEAIYNLAALIEGTRDLNRIALYIDRLAELKLRLVALQSLPPRADRAASP